MNKDKLKRTKIVKQEELPKELLNLKELKS